ncbi:MAG: carboxymuconolactone decarboxylase family protein [Gammaproteobacteria bacterium]
MTQKEAFETYRTRMNQRLTDLDNRVIKRVFSVDSLAYETGVLDRPTKELIGLVASLVLRCDDCVRYHLNQLDSLGLSQEAIVEALGIGLVVGGTIVIPHLRRAIDYLDELKGQVRSPE